MVGAAGCNGSCLFRQAWERQARALLLLCAGALGSCSAGSRDGLLELAAARLLVLLQDADSWACFAKGVNILSFPSS